MRFLVLFSHKILPKLFLIFFFVTLFFLIFKFYFIFKLYIIVLVLPNIKMNPPQVYMCSPSWTLFLRILSSASSLIFKDFYTKSHHWAYLASLFLSGRYSVASLTEMESFLESLKKRTESCTLFFCYISSHHTDSLMSEYLNEILDKNKAHLLLGYNFVIFFGLDTLSNIHLKFLHVCLLCFFSGSLWWWSLDFTNITEINVGLIFYQGRTQMPQSPGFPNNLLLPLPL